MKACKTVAGSAVVDIDERRMSFEHLCQVSLLEMSLLVAKIHNERHWHFMLLVNRKYDINPELFFQLDEGDRRGHDQKLFKKTFRLNVRKYAFSNRVIDNWNLLSANCVNCSAINTFKKHLSSELESEAVKFKVSQL